MATALSHVLTRMNTKSIHWTKRLTSPIVGGSYLLYILLYNITMKERVRGLVGIKFKLNYKRNESRLNVPQIQGGGQFHK